MLIMINYRQYRKVNRYEVQNMNHARNIYMHALSSSSAISVFGYEALATNREENLSRSIRLVREVQESLRTTLLQTRYSPYGMGSNETIQIYEGYLLDFQRLSDYFKKALELDFNKNYYNNLKQIEDEIIQELNIYINYHGVRSTQEEIVSEREERRSDYEYNEKAMMDMISKFEREATEAAMEYMEIIIPNYKGLGYELVGLTGTGYSTSPPMRTVSISFVKKNIGRNMDANIQIELTLDGKLSAIYTYYSRKDGRSSDDLPIDVINFTKEEIVKLTADRIKSVYSIEALDINSYTEGDGRATIYYDTIINGVIVNMNISATVALDDGRIERFHGFRGYVEYEKIAERIINLNYNEILAEEKARESIGSQNKVLGEGSLYYRHNYGVEDNLLYRFDIQTGERILRVYIDAFTGEEVNFDHMN